MVKLVTRITNFTVKCAQWAESTTTFGPSPGAANATSASSHKNDFRYKKVITRGKGRNVRKQSWHDTQIQWDKNWFTSQSMQCKGKLQRSKPYDVSRFVRPVRPVSEFWQTRFRDIQYLGYVSVIRLRTGVRLFWLPVSAMDFVHCIAVNYNSKQNLWFCD